MTNFVRRVLNFLALLLLFFLGVEFLLWTVLVQSGDSVWLVRSFVVTFQSLSPVGQFAISAALILLPLFILSLTVRVHRKQVILHCKTKDGDAINLTEEAVRRCLHHEIRAIPEVAGIRSRIRNGQTGPRVLLRLWIWAGADVPAARRGVREEAARALRHLFGIGEIENIQVIIEGLVFRKSRGRKGVRRPSKADNAEDEG